MAVVKGLQENVVKYGLLFWMRMGVAPFWEDPKNRGIDLAIDLDSRTSKV